jgi:hypothetical protein
MFLWVWWVGELVRILNEKGWEVAEEGAYRLGERYGIALGSHYQNGKK